jgi:hypothetical protein
MPPLCINSNDHGKAAPGGATYVAHFYELATTPEDDPYVPICIAGPFPNAQAARAALAAGRWEERGPGHWSDTNRRGAFADIVEVTSLPQA